MMPRWAVLIAEDDALYRASIVHAVPWAELDCVLIAAVSNGEDALEVVRNRRIDLLVTDVEMPGINGIELMTGARALRPDLQCLMLSNFDTFDYVKSSLKQGADDYLLKQALTPGALREAVGRIVALRASEAALQEAPHTDAGWGLMLRRDITRALLTGELVEERRASAGAVLFPGEGCSHILTLGFAMTRYLEHLATIPRDTTKGQFVGMFLDVCEEALGRGAVAAAVDENLYGALVPVSAHTLRPTGEGELLMIGERLASASAKLLNAGIVVEFGPATADLASVGEAWPEVHARLQIRQSEIQPPDGPAEGSHIALLELSQERDLFAAIVAGESERVSSLVTALFPATSEMGPTGRAFLMLANDLINLGIRVCKNRGLAPESFLGRADVPQATIARAASLEELVGYVDERLCALAGRFKGAASGSPLVQRATAIIHTRFGESLTLAGVANEIGISPSHLSRLLSASTGTGFSEELTKTRLEAAKELLNDESLSVHQISKRCGYANYTYFFNVFRKHEGMTPQTYRKRSPGI